MENDIHVVSETDLENAKMERSKAAHPSMGSGFPPAEQMDRLLVRVDKLEKQMSIVFVRLGIKKDDN